MTVKTRKKPEANDADTALVTTDVTVAHRPSMTEEQVDLLKRTICVGASNDELQLFLMVCEKSGLDPFSKQIHAVRRQGKMVIQVGIDGYRLIADRTGRYCGNDDPVFDDEGNPQKATVTVWKMVGGVRCPFTASARWAQYCPDARQDFMWRKMPHLMLGKVAEALALRKAFPAELSGLYVREEMDQAVPDGQAPHESQPTATVIVQGQHVAGPAPASEAPKPSLIDRLHLKDKALTDEGVCKAGALVVYVLQQTLEAGADPDPKLWSDNDWHEAGRAAKRFECEQLFRTKGKRHTDAIRFLKLAPGTAFETLDAAQLRKVLKALRELPDAPTAAAKAS